MSRCFLIVDIQNDYFASGAFPLPGAEAAADAAAVVLASARRSRLPVIHLRHVWDAPDATFMRPGTAGMEIHPVVAPEEGELVLDKTSPNGFLGTTLHEELVQRGVDDLLIAGMMTSMCVDATARAAADLGFTVTVVHDACAAPDLEFGNLLVSASSVQAAFMAALGDGYATLASASSLAGEGAGPA